MTRDDKALFSLVVVILLGGCVDIPEPRIVVPYCDKDAPAHVTVDSEASGARSAKTANLFVERGWKNVTLESRHWWMSDVIHADCPEAHV